MAEKMNKLYIVGIGFKPLEKKVIELLLKSSFIVISPRLHEVFKKYEIYDTVKEKIVEIKKLEDTLGFIKEHLLKSDITLLASGDPLYFGIGVKAIEIFGEERVEIYPDLSCLQKGLSLIKKNWHGIPTLSFHGRPFEPESFINMLFKHGKLAILTDTANSPDNIAKKMLSLNENFLKNLKFYIFERLGYEDEKVIIANLAEVANQSFKEPNFMIVTLDNSKNEKILNEDCIFGIEEREINHISGMITKDEIRACIIHKLRLPKKCVVWDIGAGSGSVSIEIARFSEDIKVYAIEKGSIDLIEDNLKKFGVKNVEVIKGEAPDCLINLLEPDRVFIGGSGGRLSEILNFLYKISKLKIIVLSAVSMETLESAINFLEEKGFEVDVCQLSVTRLEKKYGRRFFKALNPIFIVRGKR